VKGHLPCLATRSDRFNNELIICAHFSTRYHPNEMRRLIEAKLPPRLREKMKLWV
jgi:ribonuclease Z